MQWTRKVSWLGAAIVIAIAVQTFMPDAAAERQEEPWNELESVTKLDWVALKMQVYDSDSNWDDDHVTYNFGVSPASDGTVECVVWYSKTVQVGYLESVEKHIRELVALRRELESPWLKVNLRMVPVDR